MATGATLQRMGLLPPVILGALLIVAFALSAQQRLGLASHAPPMPARQVAYLMRAYHQAAINLKLADHSLTGPLSVPASTVNPGEAFFLSCADAKAVVTMLNTIDPTPVLELGTAEVRSIVAELARQTVLPPELGMTGRAAWAVGYNNNRTALITPAPGVGLADFSFIYTATGPIPIPPCLFPLGTAAIVTQVLP